MKDDTIYLLYNTNASNIKLQNQPVKRGSFDWEYVDKDRFTIMYNPEDVRKSTEIKIRSKTKLRDRPKSAGEVMTLPKINAEGILIKKSISLSNIDDFFLKRRIPLIKPLLSEREIMKIQLLQQQCRKKRIGFEPDKTSLKSVDIEDGDLKKYKGYQLESEEEKLKDKTRDVTSPILSPTDKSTGKEDKKKPGDKRQKESEKDKKVKSPASGKSGHEGKKLKKEPTFIKPKSDIGKGKKKEKSGASKKEKPETNKRGKIEKSKKEKQRQSLKDKTKKEKPGKFEQSQGAKSAKVKAKTSLSESESGSKTANLGSKTKDQARLSKSKSKEMSESEEEGGKSKRKKSGHSMKHEDTDKTGSKGSSRTSSKQRLKSEQSDKDVQLKKSKDHSKERLSLGKKSEKSDKSDKSGSHKSGKMSDSSKKLKGMDKDGKETEMKDQIVRKPLDDSGDERKVSDDATGKSELFKKDQDKKTKPGTLSDKTSRPLSKEKTSKTDGEEKTQKTKKESGGKSVKFPNNVFQHIVHYVLSNPVFLKLGWTLAPSDRAQLLIITFRAVPVTPHTYCFRERTEDEIRYYSRALENIAFHFRKDGTGEIFYPSRVTAATITKHSTGMRLTLYSDPKNDPLIPNSFESKVLGIFDSYGNGVVYDMEGKKLLNFNQLEGISCSPHRKTPYKYKWQWCDYKILDKQRLKALLRYMAKEQKQPVPTKKFATPTTGSPKRPKSIEKAKPEEKIVEVDEAYEQILAELPYPVPQKTKTKSESHVWGFKPITLKINSEMTLRINGQDDVAVNFSSNQIFLRIDLGVKVDPDVVERIEALTPKITCDVPCVFDGLLELSPSLQQLTAPSNKATLKKKLSTT